MPGYASTRPRKRGTVDRAAAEPESDREESTGGAG